MPHVEVSGGDFVLVIIVGLVALACLGLGFMFRRDLFRAPPNAVGVMPDETLEPDLDELLVERPYRLAWTYRGARVWMLDVEC